MLLAVLCSLLAIVAMARWTAGGKEIIPWRTDFNAAVKEAQATHRPLMLYFTADWCGPCQSLKGTLWADPQVEKTLRNFVPVKIDEDQHPDIAQRFPGNYIPRYVIVDPELQQSKTTDGVLTSAEFITWLSQPKSQNDK